MNSLSRRQIRYICFRLQTAVTGGPPADVPHADEVKQHMESQEDFGGWSNFAKTWDVDEKAQLVAVTRTSSIHTEWNKVVEREAKDLPMAAAEESSPLAKAVTAVTGKLKKKK